MRIDIGRVHQDFGTDERVRAFLILPNRLGTHQDNVRPFQYANTKNTTKTT